LAATGLFGGRHRRTRKKGGYTIDYTGNVIGRIMALMSIDGIGEEQVIQLLKGTHVRTHRRGWRLEQMDTEDFNHVLQTERNLVGVMGSLEGSLEYNQWCINRREEHGLQAQDILATYREEEESAERADMVTFMEDNIREHEAQNSNPFSRMTADEVFRPHLQDKKKRDLLQKLEKHDEKVCSNKKKWKQMKKTEVDEIPTCGICLENFDEEEMDSVSLCGPNGHPFHEQCMLEWLITENANDGCPICRQNFFGDPTRIRTRRTSVVPQQENDSRFREALRSVRDRIRNGAVAIIETVQERRRRIERRNANRRGCNIMGGNRKTKRKNRKTKIKNRKTKRKNRKTKKK